MINQPRFTVLGGFLGSGKTTLLKDALHGGLAGRRVAVLVNEAGAIGIDGTVIRGFGAVERVIELGDGCICCIVDEYRLSVALREVAAAAAPDLVIIELSGIADPRGVVERVRYSGFRCDAVIVVVDAENFSRLSARHEVLERQVAAADFVVVNKTDLVAPRAAARLARALKRLNRRAVVFQTAHGKADAAVLFGVRPAAGSGRAQGQTPVPGLAMAEASGHGIDCFTCSSERPFDVAAFERFLSGLPAQIYRAKGFLRDAESGRARLFNYVAGRHDLRVLPAPVGNAVATQAVFFGWRAWSVRDAVCAQFHGCAKGVAAARA